MYPSMMGMGGLGMMGMGYPYGMMGMSPLYTGMMRASDVSSRS
jgi:hypothetical protein